MKRHIILIAFAALTAAVLACKDNVYAAGEKEFGDICTAANECGANLLCTEGQCAWDPNFTIPFADQKLKQAVIDAIKETDPAYNATDVKVSDCQKLPKKKWDNNSSKWIIAPDGKVALFAGSKGITDISGIQYCTNLQWLNLYSNQLTSLPADIFSGLTDLQGLDLNDNKLTSNGLPANIFSELTSLQRLNLYSNQLTSLPADIFSGLTNLQGLFLYNNKLTSLPANIFAELTNLQGLGLSYNQLTSLPADIFSGLTKLQELYLGGNQISDIAPLASLRGLNYLDLQNNCISVYKSLSDTGLGKGDTLKVSDIKSSCDAANLDKDLCVFGNTLLFTSMKTRGVKVTYGGPSKAQCQ